MVGYARPLIFYVNPKNQGETLLSFIQHDFLL